VLLWFFTTARVAQPPLGATVNKQQLIMDFWGNSSYYWTFGATAVITGLLGQQQLLVDFGNILTDEQDFLGGLLLNSALSLLRPTVGEHRPEDERVGDGRFPFKSIAALTSKRTNLSPFTKGCRDRGASSANNVNFLRAFGPTAEKGVREVPRPPLKAEFNSVFRQRLKMRLFRR